MKQMNRERNQLIFVSAMAVLVFVISVWAFIQGVRAGGQEGIVQEKSSARSSSVKEPGEKKKTGTDTKKLAEAVFQGVDFDTDLSLMEESVAQSMLTTASEDTKVELYMGQGTCADELLILSVSDKSKLDGEIEVVQKHLADMQQSFQDYLPEEAKKIDDAVILQAGNYIVVCVSSQKEEAKKIISGQLK